MRQALLFALFTIAVWADAHLFVYHRFGDDRHASTSVSLSTLQKQFDYFKDNNYHVISLSRLNKALKAHEKIPDNWVVLTIDDSYKSFFDNGLSLFKAYNYPFTLFVYIEATERHYGDFMDWEEIKEASRHGEIGLHSYGHKHMVSLSGSDIRNDTEKAIASFKSNLGYAPKYYAYPYGEFDDKVKKIVSSYDFDLVLNQNAGAVCEKSPHNDLDRIALTGEVNLRSKLRIKYLDAIWHSPKSYPHNGKLNNIHVTMPDSISKAELYVTGAQWEYVNVSDGELKVNRLYPLNKNRVRVIIKSDNAWSSKVLVKE